MLDHNISRKNFLRTLSLTSLALIPGMNVLSSIVDAGGGGLSHSALDNYFIDAAYRLMHYQNMLELEFYFINVDIEHNANNGTTYIGSPKIFGKSAHSYMIVRLPQQHVAEEYVDAILLNTTTYSNKIEESRIAGYSYLCFQLDFFTLNKIPVTAHDLMNWNGSHFSLISKPDNEIRPFVVDTDRVDIDNYPLSFNNKHYHRRYYPNGRKYREIFYNAKEHATRIRDAAPFTALEIPYRLIISPRLPSSEYAYEWVFTSYIGESLVADVISTTHSTELWMATLKIKKISKKEISNVRKDKNNEDPNSLTGSQDDPPQDGGVIINREDNQIQLMILGPSYLSDTTKILSTLPSEENRQELIKLFNNFNLYAVTPSLTVTPLGVSTHIVFRNKFFDQDRIPLYQWKHVISFGRDQEVEVSNVVVDATFGLKMLHVSTTMRETYKGRALLLYREYLMPLEIEKDFASFVPDATDGAYMAPNSKYQTPFQNVKFADLRPRQIIPVSGLGNDISVVDPTTKNKIAYWAVTPDNKLLEWPIIMTDWASNSITLQKHLFILTSDLKFAKDNDGNNPYILDGQLPSVTILGPNPIPATLKLLNLAIQKIRSNWTSGSIWQKITNLSEGNELTIVSDCRTGIKQLLQKIETQLQQQATAGENDIEDQVMEEWNLAKRQAMGIEQNFEGIYYDLLQKLTDKIHNSPITIDDINSKIVILQNKIYNNENVDKITSYARADIRSQINSIKNGLPNSGISTFQDLSDDLNKKLVDIDNIVNLGFTYQINTIWSKLPPGFVAPIKNEVTKDLAALGALYTHVQYAESNLRSKINGGKSSICFAVHQAEDEMEVLKKALKAEFPDPVRFKEAYEQYSKEFANEVSGKLATLQTDYLIFANNLRMSGDDVTKKAFDFFNPYACYPQLHTAQGYAESVNSLVKKEIPLKIKYAEDYIKYQVNNDILEVKNNASRVFAEVHEEAKEWLKGAVREAGKEIGGIVNPEIAADFLTYLKDKKALIKDTLTQGQAAINNAIDSGKQLEQQYRSQAEDTITGFKGDLNRILQPYNDDYKQFKSQLLTLTQDAQQALKTEELAAKMQGEIFFKGLEAKILGSIRLRDLLGVDFNLPKLQRLPDRITYSLITSNFKSFDVKVFRFIPNDSTKLTTWLEVPIKDPSNFRSDTRLENFTVSIFGDRLFIGFNDLRLRSDKQSKNQVNVQLGDVDFGKELAFLKALSQGFMLPGTGLNIKISLTDIDISYALPIPGISGGAFTFDNLKFVVGTVIPLPTGLSGTNQPVAIKLGINTPEDPFAVGVLIFGGMGHLDIETTPKYIKRVDAGISFGGLFQINLVIASGQAFLQAGVRYVYERTDLGTSHMELYALLTCGANVTVFGFIELSVVFTMYLKYQKDSGGSSLYGVASVAYSIRIGFFSKSFSLTFSQRIAGSDRSGSTAFNSPTHNPLLPEEETMLAAAGYPVRKHNDEERLFAKLDRNTNNLDETLLYERNDGVWDTPESESVSHTAAYKTKKRKEANRVRAKNNLKRMYKSYCLKN